MDDKVKIVFLLPALSVGGAEMVMARLANNIDRRKFQPFFITATAKGRLRDYIKDDVEFFNLKAVHALWSLPRLYHTLRRIDPDIVFSTIAHANFLSLSLRLFFPRTRFIVRESTIPNCTLHGRGVLKPLIKVAYKILYPRADLILAPAGLILDRLQDQIGLTPTRMKILLNPVDTDMIQPVENNEMSPPGLNFAAAGRLHFEKGFDRLIEALAGFKPEFPWHLSILGEGSEEDNLKNLIERHALTSHVTLKGFHKNPWKLVGAADYFLLPSRWEGSPNAALEALACGVPVIALRAAGGIVDIAAETPPGAVLLCENMDDFIKTLENLKPPSHPKTSLLPEKYTRTCVIKSFERMLDELRA